MVFFCGWDVRGAGLPVDERFYLLPDDRVVPAIRVGDEIVPAVRVGLDGDRQYGAGRHHPRTGSQALATVPSGEPRGAARASGRLGAVVTVQSRSQRQFHRVYRNAFRLGLTDLGVRMRNEVASPR